MSQLYSNKSTRRELFYATPATGTRKIQSTVPPMNKAQSMRCLHQLLSSHHGHGFDRRWTSPITYSNSDRWDRHPRAKARCRSSRVWLWDAWGGSSPDGWESVPQESSKRLIRDLQIRGQCGDAGALFFP
ncbi:hypothetical protein VPH35_089768 [Triticum aestivum]